jgi:hypothetical protein
MKKALVLALCVVGFILIAAPTAVEYSPLFINGKPAGQAVLINGVIAISVENFAKAGGATLTLQPNFQRQGPKLLALLGSDMKKAQPAAKEKWTPATGAGVPAVQAGMIKQDVGGLKQTPAPGQIFRVQRAGEVSSHVFDFEGKGYLPVADLARALGTTFTAPAAPAAPGATNAASGGIWKPGDPIRLSSSPNGILIGL